MKNKQETLLDLYIAFAKDTYIKEGLSERYQSYHRVVMALSTGDPGKWLRQGLENAPEEHKIIYQVALASLESDV